MTELRRRSPVFLGLTLILLALYLPWLWSVRGTPPDPVLANVFHDAITLGAALTVWQAQRNTPAARRGALTLLAVGLTAYLLADVTWGVQELRGGGVPYPSLYLLAYPLVGLALLRLSPLPSRFLKRLRLALDSLIVVGGVATLLWWTVLHTYLPVGQRPDLSTVVNFLYPLFSLGFLTLLLMLVLQGQRLPRHLTVLGLGLGITVAADLWYVWVNLVGDFYTGHPADGLFSTGVALWALGGWLATDPEHRGHGLRVPLPLNLRRAFALLPYLTVGALSVMVLWLPLSANLRERGVLVGAVLTMLLVLIRQGVTFHDNLRLTRRLRDTNRELEHANAELERSRRQLGHQARHDALTGLPNRLHFEEQLRRALRPGAFGQLEPFAVMFLDLDGFKEVNDSFGHAAGDELLVQVAARLRASLRASDLVARQGGDEFLVLLRPANTAEAVASGQRLLASLAKPLFVRGNRLRVSASVGVSLFPPHSRDAAELCRRADLAMYQAKGQGKNTVQVYGDGAPGRDGGTGTHPVA